MNNIIKRIEFLKKRYPNYKMLLDFFSIILIERNEYPFEPNIEPMVLEDDDLKKIEKGYPISDFKNLEIDIQHSFKLFCQICDKFKKNVNFKDTINKLSFVYDDFQMFNKIFKDLNNNNKLDLSYDSNVNQLLIFIILNSIRPSFKKLLKNITIPDSLWQKGICPICGNEPFFGVIKDDSKKIIECQFCGFQWKIERIFCPFCENRDQDKLKYFEDENDIQYRVYLCDKCKKYLKFIKEKEAVDFSDLMIEDIVTVHLDIIAKENGYVKN